jgi:hypothetical protein
VLGIPEGVQKRG